jgi:hypothetical protein
MLSAGTHEAEEGRIDGDHATEAEGEDEYRDTVYEKEARACRQMLAPEPDAGLEASDEENTDQDNRDDEAQEQHGTRDVHDVLHQGAATPTLRPVRYEGRTGKHGTGSGSSRCEIGVV